MAIGDKQRLRGSALITDILESQKSIEAQTDTLSVAQFLLRRNEAMIPQTRLAQRIQFREDADTFKTIQIDNRTGVIEDFVTENPELESAIRKMGEEDRKLREIDDFIKSQTPVEETPQQKKGLAAFEQLRQTPVGFVLKAFERGVVNTGKFFSSSILSGIGSMIMNSIVNNPTSTLNLEERQRIGEALSEGLADAADRIEEKLDALVAKKPEELQINDLQDLLDLRKMTSLIIESAPTTAALALVSIVTGGIALLPIIFTSVTGSSTKELMERTDLSLPQKLATAQTIAAVESALEIIGLGTITDAAKKTVRGNVLRAIRGEGATELGQEVNEILQKEGIEPFKSQQAWAQVLAAGLVGGITGGVLGMAFQNKQQEEEGQIAAEPIEPEIMSAIQEVVDIGRQERNVRDPEGFMRPQPVATVPEEITPEAEEFVEEAEAIGVPEEQIVEEVIRLSEPQNTAVKTAQKDSKTSKIPKEDTEALYQEAQNVSTLDRIKKALRPTFTSQQNMSASESIVGSVSSGLNSINTAYGTALRNMEFRKNQLVKQWSEQSLDFFKLAKKMTRKDLTSFRKSRNKLVMDLALANGNVAKTTEVINRFEEKFPSKFDSAKAVNDVRSLLNEVFDLAQSRDINFGRVEAFFPRVVTDLRGLTKKLRGTEFRGVFSEAIKEAERKKGRTLTEEEQLAIIDRTISYRSSNAKTSSSIKERRITTLNADLYEHYATSEQALNLYFQRMANAIAQQEFFRELGIEPEAKNINLDTAGLELDEISTSLLSDGLSENLNRLTLNDMQSGRLKPQDENKLKDLLTSRFNFEPMHPALRRAKTLSVGILLGRGVTSTVRQFSEIGIAFYRSGVYSTGKAAIMAFSGRSKITMKDLGIENISAAFVDMGKTGRLTDIMLRVNLFRGADRLSKETQVNAEIDALSRRARRNKLTEKDNRTIDAIFGKAPEIKEQLLEDLKTGNVTQDVKLLAFHDISGYQPISLSELPPAYFNVKNGRIFYTFKTFQAKRIDFIREEALRDMFSKDRTKKQRVDALGRLVLLATILGLTELGSLEVILWMRGQMNADDFPDKFWDSMMRSLFGINKYAIGIAERDGIATALTEEFTGIPLTFVDDIGKDLWSFFREDGQSLKTIQSIRNTTLIGEAYYFWMGAGKIKNVDRYLRSVREEARERKFSRFDRIAILSTIKRYFNNKQISSRQRDNVLRLLNENELSRLPESTVNNFFQQMKQEIIEVTGIPETLFQK